MWRLATLALVVVLPEIAHAQVPRLTAERAGAILALAETARLTAGDDGVRAAQVFRAAYRTSFAASSRCNVKYGLQASPTTTCFCSPTEWYVRLLSDALRHNLRDLSSVRGRDTFIIVVASQDPRRPPPRMVWIHQVAPEHSGELEAWTKARKIAPVLEERRLMEFEDEFGVTVTLAAGVFHFDVDQVNVSKVTRVDGLSKNGDAATIFGVSARVMESIR